MSNVSNPNLSVSRQDLADFYDKIFPYLGGKASAGFTPVGTVISVMGVTAPANYLACDGTVYNISDYPELARYFGQQFSMVNNFGGDGTTTFAVPDLRGEFLRGTGTNSHANQGSGANVGVHQHATDIPFYTVQKSSNNTLRMINNSETEETHHNADSIYLVNGSGSLSWVQLSGTTQATGNTKNAITLRPTNTSVLWCIATKNIYMNPSLDYSTDEKVVGSWIDGSTVYQRTWTNLSVQLTQSDTWATLLDASGLNLNNLIDSKCYTSEFRIVPLELTHNPSTHLVRVRPNTIAGSETITTVTLQYTKTTD